jgi:hypothetical protein
VPPGLRLAMLPASALLFVALPVGDATVLFVLVLALDLAAAVLALHRLAPSTRSGSVVAVVRQLGLDPASLHLLRRTVPELRGRRPPVVLAAQVRWRRAAETHRSRSEAS